MSHQVESSRILSMVSNSTTRTPDSEVATIKRILSGQRDEFRFLVDRHQDYIYAMIMRQVGEAHIARELTQDTFVRAYRNLSSFRAEAKFSTWLTRIALNLCNNYFKSARYQRRQREVTLSHSAKRSVEMAQEIEEQREQEHDLIILEQHVHSLKAIYREVVVLCCFENKTYEQTAEILEIPLGTVCSRMNKAFQLLREKFACD